MTPFELRVSVLTPIVMPFATPLDGLLAYAAHQLTGLTGEALLPHIPLQRWRDNGPFHASSARLIRPRPGRAALVGRLTPSDLEADKLHPRQRRKVDVAKGSYAARLHHYPVCDAIEARFSAVGEPDAVLSLMRLVTGLGKRAPQGMGQIGTMRVVPLADDESLVDAQGQAARPLPVPMYRRLTGSEPDAVECQPFAVVPSYWEGEKVSCVMPTLFI